MAQSVRAKALRAVGAAWAERSLRRIALVAQLVSLFLILVALALAVFLSRWWLILLGAVLILSLAAWIAATVARSAIRRVSSAETPEQRALAASIADKASGLADLRNTRRLLLALKVLFGFLRGNSFIGGLVDQATTANAEFGELCRAFA
ncbi:MAG: hypothetical protein LBC97_05000 [Bifidobacteriaceae bacterium]|nr:hypothetical protein [Bifidobacteriaceae bacterium]